MLYEQNRAIFTKDAYKIQSTHPDIRNLDDLFRQFVNASQQVESHSVWRCNRMAPARLLRSIFPRPARLPPTGVSLERYLIVDSPQALPYRIPDAECANMFVIQGYGSRTFLLRPTQECRHRCRTLSVRLPASYGRKFAYIESSKHFSDDFYFCSDLQLVVLEADFASGAVRQNALRQLHRIVLLNSDS